MKILAIETSCDETAAAVLERNGNEIKIISSIISSSASLHALTGGIIPEQAAREQVKLMIPVIKSALNEAGIPLPSAKTKLEQIDALAVTYGPGLIGSLLIGVETAKTFSYIFHKPLVPINHLLAHIFANFIRTDINDIPFPFIGLIVSGGHTDLLCFKSFEEYQWLGGTRDDAAGEAFDKTGRLLNLSYPAGPVIEKRALEIDAHKNVPLSFKSPMLHDPSLDFSFSGLKTEVSRFIQKQKNLAEVEVDEICYAVQKSIIDVLAVKTLRAAEQFNAKSLVIGGGVSANNALRTRMQEEINNRNLHIPLFFPIPSYTTDNAAMIGTAALLNYNPRPWQEIKSNPELYFA